MRVSARPERKPPIRDSGLFPTSATLPSAITRTRTRSHLDEPIRLFQNLRIMVDQQHRIPVRHQVAYHAVQSHDVGRMQPDGGLVKHIQHTGRPVAYRPGKLHPLPLSGREGGRSPVERQVAESQVHQPHGRRPERFADAPGHRLHLFGQGSRYTVHPFHEFGQRHPAGLIEGDTPQSGRPRRFGQARSAARRTHLLLQKPGDTLHSLLILDFRQRILYGINRIEIGKVHLTRSTAGPILVNHVVLDGRPVEHDFPLFRCQQAKRYVGTHTQIPGDILHQRPHQCLPGQYSPLVYGKGFIGHEGRFIHNPDTPGTAALGTGPLTVEREFLRPRCIEMLSALGTDEFAPCGNGKGGRRIVTVRTAVAGQSRIHQPQTVQ